MIKLRHSQRGGKKVPNTGVGQKMIGLAASNVAILIISIMSSISIIMPIIINTSTNYDWEDPQWVTESPQSSSST